MYAYIESSTAIIWATSTKEYTVEEIAESGLPVDIRRDDAPNNIISKASNLDVYYIWDGIEYKIQWVLNKLKILKNESIDIKTQQLIYAGIQYDGKIFSLQLTDQSSWHGMFNAVVSGIAQYPLKVMTKLDEPYYLNNAEEFYNMYFSGFSAVAQILEGGRTLKAQVNAATSKEELDSIVDPR